MFAFIQARQTSKRFPNKIYANLAGAPILFHVISRVKEAKLIDDVIVTSPAQLPELPRNTREFIYSDDENDVLSRFAKCEDSNPCDYVVRITADCPLIDPMLIDYIVLVGLLNNADYCSNVIKRSFPDGLDTEIISSKMLKWLNENIKAPYHREHVTSAIMDNPNIVDEFNLVSVVNNIDKSHLRWTVDTREDLEKLQALNI